MPNPTPKQAWTPEPWAVKPVSEDRFAVTKEGGGVVAIVDRHRDGWTPYRKAAQPDAERIAVCVNALSGIKDPAAYLETVRKLVETAMEASGAGCEWELDQSVNHCLNSEQTLKARIEDMDAALSTLRKQEQDNA